MSENLMIPGWEDEYRAFTEKFRAKKTTDDCYTPEAVYEAVAGWVAQEYRADKGRFLRPFYPGGDYEHFDYPEGCAVVDNPPFSLITKIVRFYAARGIPFFLFAPALTLFQAYAEVTYIPVGVSITYENGAKVATSFITNLDEAGLRVRTAPELYRAAKEADSAGRGERRRVYRYPDNILTAAMAQRWGQYGVDFRLYAEDCRPITVLDAQRVKGVTIFGGGYLLGTAAAAERAAAERAAAERAAAERAAAERAAAERGEAWELSESEHQMVAIIDRGKT